MIYKYTLVSIILFLLTINLAFTQIKGYVLTSTQQPISAATISIQNAYIATSTNSNGEFEIKADNIDSCTLIIQHLGYSSQRIEWTKKQKNTPLTIILQAKNIEIEEVSINTRNNTVDQIIKNTIDHRDKNRKTIDKYEADFYSKGSMRLVNIPKKILGAKLDTITIRNETGGTNILYLSETISQIKVERPKKMYEKIIASKVSGNNQGLSFNRADGSDFEIYSNYIDFENIKAISPIADQAFSYYTYQLVNSFEEQNQLIHKIKITPKRNAEPIFDGYIYIVDGSWQIYATEIYTLGSRVNIPIIDTLYIAQQYTYNEKDNRWIKQLQVLDLTAGIFNINVKGNFVQTFSNYNFEPLFDKNTFTRTITEFEEDANNKNDDYWETHRKVPLSTYEIMNYHIKDSIYHKKQEQTYIDSVDAAKSKFRAIDIITSYHYQNTPKKIYIDYESPISLERISFNTVQVWNIKSSINARFGNYRDPKLTSAGVLFNYQFIDKKLYKVGYISHRFNRKKYNELKISLGDKAEQFNSDDPIGPFINMISSLFFKENYMKLYETQFIAAEYSQYLHPNIKLYTYLNYQKRKNLYNRTSYSFSEQPDKGYTPNNPLDPNDPESSAFVNHNILKAKASIDIYFGTKTEKLSNDQINYLHSNKYPQLTLTYSSALTSSVKDYRFQEFSTTIRQDINFGNKGLLGYKAQLGTFVDGKNIAFIDYKHFNGNRTHIATTKRYLDSYLMLPYYSYSTNKSYLELHTEYNFQGYILNKIPIISKLNWNTHIGFHLLANDTKRPYQEITFGFGNIGWGKYRFFRIDYVHTRHGMLSPNGIVIGVSFLDALIQN